MAGSEDCSVGAVPEGWLSGAGSLQPQADRVSSMDAAISDAISFFFIQVFPFSFIKSQRYLPLGVVLHFPSPTGFSVETTKAAQGQ